MSVHPWGAGSTWVTTGRFGFLLFCFLAFGGHCLQMLCLPGLGTQANTQNLPHFRAFSASIWELSPPKCRFSMANARLPNRPGFALPYGQAPELLSAMFQDLLDLGANSTTPGMIWQNQSWTPCTFAHLRGFLQEG